MILGTTLNKPLAIVSSMMLGFGVVLIVASYFAARAQGGWQPEADDPERYVMPLEWVAFGGVSCALLAPLLYLTGRTNQGGRTC